MNTLEFIGALYLVLLHPDSTQHTKEITALKKTIAERFKDPLSALYYTSAFEICLAQVIASDDQQLYLADRFKTLAESHKITLNDSKATMQEGDAPSLKTVIALLCRELDKQMRIITQTAREQLTDLNE